jgi:hypothetical protein
LGNNDGELLVDSSILSTNSQEYIGISNSSSSSSANTSSGERLDLLVMILVTLRMWFNSSVLLQQQHIQHQQEHVLIAETLQTILISNDLSQRLTLDGWKIIFDRVLFPLLAPTTTVITSTTTTAGVNNNVENLPCTDQIASNLVTKVFCCHAEVLSSLLPKIVSALIRDFIEVRHHGKMTESQMKDYVETFQQRLINLCRVVIDRVDNEDWNQTSLLLDEFWGNTTWKDELLGAT